MSTTGLPTSLELQNAADADDEEKCQSLVLQAIQYGTEFSFDDTDGKKKTIEQRTQEACTVLADAWEDCLKLEDSLVDALWLRGSVLTSMATEKATSPPSSGGGSNSNNNNVKSGPTTEELSIKALIEIIKILVQIPDRPSFWKKLQGNLMLSLVEASGLASEQDLLKRCKLLNTQTSYKQQKYNLLQEESEGYAKLLHFLMTPSTNSSEDGCEKRERRSKLHQLVGTFELDPNRVLDLIVDMLGNILFPSDSSNDGKRQQHQHQHQHQHQQLSSNKKKPKCSKHVQSLLFVMKELALDRLPALIHFKLTRKDSKRKGAVQNTHCLLQTIAFLVAEGMMDLRTMVENNGSVDDTKIEKANGVLWLKEKRRIQAMARISLTGGAKKEDPKQAELSQQLEQLLEPLRENDLLKIILVLLEWGEWDLVRPLLPISSWSNLCNLMPTKFGFALCEVVRSRIATWYSSKVGGPSLLVAPTTKSDNSTVAVEKEEPEIHAEDGKKVDDNEEVTLEKLVQVISGPLLCTVRSSCIAFHPKLYCQICRLFNSLLSTVDGDYKIDDKTYTLFKSFLVPSLSLFPSNPALSTELWMVMKQLPYSTRYRLYDDWRGSGLERAGLSSSSNVGKPLLNVQSEMGAGKAARYALKRLSKDNIRDMSRQLAKVTHSNPLVVYATILNQIESYDNMVEVMVEAQRFVNPLGLDVLAYCILSRLSGMDGGVNRSRLKEDGVNVSQWLQSLESFSGAFFKRCPNVEFRGILCYLMKRLREGNVMELGILRTLLKVAGGYSFEDYEPAASLNETQLEGRAGSITLKRETMSFGIVEDINMRASGTIRHVLQTDGFGVSILILVAQVRSRILFESSKGSPNLVKLVGNLYDSCQVVMSILLEFLTNEPEKKRLKGNDDNDESLLKYAASLPTFEDLRSRYGFDPESVWMLCRPLVRLSSRIKTKKEGQNESLPSQLTLFLSPEEFKKSYIDMLPEEGKSGSTSPGLYGFFFSHSYYDIYFPQAAYTGENNRVAKEIERIQQRQKSGTMNMMNTGVGTPKHDLDELDRLKSVSQKLLSDSEAQKEHVSLVRQGMEKTKDEFFINDSNMLKSSAQAFLRQCVFPRSSQSPDDALYCAHFAFQLHRMETPGFGTLHYINELVSTVAGTLFGVTEGEAANLAILLWETWKFVNKCRYEDGYYDAEMSGKPGSYILPSDQSTTSDTTIDPASHKQFAEFYNQWHATLGSALIGCLKSNEYMHTRTGLVVLTRLVEVFPTRPKLGNKLLKVLAPIQDESSSRPDIRASANAYGTMLLKARDDGKWVEEDAAVARARLEKEKVAALARKKKFELQFQELENESKQITKEIGPRDGPRDRHHHDRRRDYSGGGGGGGSSGGIRSNPDGDGRGGRNMLSLKENGKARTVASSSSQRMESGEINNNNNNNSSSNNSSSNRRDPDDRWQGRFSRASPPRDSNRGRDRDRTSADDRGHSRGVDPLPSPAVRRSDRSQHGDSWRFESTTDTTISRSNRDDHRGQSSGGWARNESTSSTVNDGRNQRPLKRSRPPSPDGGGSGGDGSRNTDRTSNKRPRMGGTDADNENDSRRERNNSPPRGPTRQNRQRRVRRN